MDPDSNITLNLLFINPDWISNIGLICLLFVVIIIMLAISTVTSAAENAFFSLAPSDLDDLENDDRKSARYALKLLKEPEEESASKSLLASILIINNFTNIFVVISSSLLLSMVFRLELYPVGGFLFEVVLITFVIVLISEVIPKIYATQNAISVVHKLSIVLYYSQKCLKPFVWVLTKSSNFLDKNFETKQHAVSLEELNHAIEITSDEDLTDEKNILKSLVNF